MSVIKNNKLKMSVKLIQNQDFTSFLETNCNFMRIAINGFEEILKHIYYDVEKLKGVPIMPDKKTALALLGYLQLNDPQTEDIIKILCGIELQRYLDWVDDYCKKYKSTREQVLKRILEGELSG